MTRQYLTHYPEAVPRLFTFYAVPYLLVAFLMFSMTLYKCSQHLRGTRFSRMPVVTLFLRDGVFLFMTILRETNTLYLLIFSIECLVNSYYGRGDHSLGQRTPDPGPGTRHVGYSLHFPSSIQAHFIYVDLQQRQEFSLRIYSLL